MSSSPSLSQIETKASVTHGDFGPREDASFGELLSRIGNDVATLVRKEVELAKLEIREEAKKAGRSAGLLGGAGIAATLGVTMLSFAAAWGLAVVIPVGFAFLAVGGLYSLAGSVMFLSGRRELRNIEPVPDQTVETLKEDAQWVKHPTK